ncbi:hypothetical protein KC343_g196 [Hortaea werneckii]|nr:hypothetical protein KC352_g6733 [Hortaea werneckii]KAI7570186.1 hypothetical protein KC317_g2682 [Hortaea werneckii]KAI7628103.1 hypothetical protein KC346_g394 [Hortaea werneckii]KAI7638271.1 hypothetical protein KC343_g196 [Hortaea werneckii]KAI7683030.1 hypothetical protein KC319_g689 [Hortaea werneckii]
MGDLGDADQNEHQKVMDGFFAQIGRLNRKLDSLRDQLIAAGDAATVEKLFDERAATKKQKDDLEKLQRLADYNSALLRAHTRALPPGVKQKQQLIVALSSSQQEAIDLTQDDIPPAIKREHSESPYAPGPAPRRPHTRHDSQHFPEQSAQQVAQNRPKPRARKARSATSSFRIDNRKFRDFRAIADSHPALVPSPDGPGAVELRCPDCGCNAVAQGNSRGGRPGFFVGAWGLLRHVSKIHKSHELCSKEMKAAAAVRDCTYNHVPQEVIDAIKSGDTEAYVVPLIQVPYGALRPLQTAENPGNAWDEDEQRTIASTDELRDTQDGHWPFRPMVP